MQDPKILAYTVSYGDRSFLHQTIQDLRGTAGLWFDWLVCLGNPSEELQAAAEAALEHPEGRGIQHLKVWPQNRGQHHATQFALELAQREGYEWLLRLDDDIQAKTKRWLKKLVTQTTELRRAAGDAEMRIISAPKLMGLNNPLSPIGVCEVPGVTFTAEAMDILGGACRLHPVEFLKDFQPSLFAPLGRQDPETLAQYVMDHEGILVRFPQIRMVHRTTQLEAHDTPGQARLRDMGRYWPYLGPVEEAQ